MKRRLIITFIAVALIAFCTAEAMKVWPFFSEVSRSAEPLTWWTFTLLICVGLKYLLVQTAKGTKRLATGQRLGCGHPLRGQVRGVCPNCGKPIGIWQTHV